MRTGIVEQQERTYRRAVAAVRKESADGKAVSNPMAAVWPHDFCDFSHGSLLAGLAVRLLESLFRRSLATANELAPMSLFWRRKIGTRERRGCAHNQTCQAGAAASVRVAAGRCQSSRAVPYAVEPAASMRFGMPDSVIAPAQRRTPHIEAIEVCDRLFSQDI